MAVEWGGWDYGSGNGMRVGIEYSVTSPSNGSSSCTFTYDIWTENQYSYNDSGEKLSYSGDISGSTTFNNNSGGSPVKRATKTYTYNYASNSYGSSPGKSDATAKLSGAYNGVTPSQTISHSIPTRPYGAPDAPSSCKATRSSDTSIAVSWSNNASTGKPYTGVWLERYTYGYQTWTRIASLSGSTTSYTDTGTTANRTYAYRVQADNSVATSGYSQSGQVWTTPAAPTSPLRTQSGTDQVLTWAQDIGYTQHETEVWRAVNSVYTLLATVGSGVKTYTDSTSSAATKVKYKFRTKSTSGPVLYSAYTVDTTETAGTPTGPLAPTQLVPSSGILDPTDAIQFTWRHNPSDGSAQSAYQVQYRYVGDSTWILAGKITSTVSSWTMPANTRAKGKQVEWQVQTWGASATLASPFSATATWTTAPIVAVKYPLYLDLTSGRTEADSTVYTPKYARELGIVDLNTITTPGVYTQSLTAQAVSGTNYPGPPIAGLLEVFSNPNNVAAPGNMIWQRYTNYALVVGTGGGSCVYVRGNYNGVWQPWVLVSEETGWVNVTPTSGTGTCRWRCLNGTVTVSMSLSGMTSLATGQNGSIFAAGTIPVAYRPSASVYAAGSAGGAGSSLGVCGGTGDCSQWNNTGGAITVARLTFTWLKE